MFFDKLKEKIVFLGNDIYYFGQINYDVCFILVSVCQYVGEFLYIIVVYWCLLQQNWVQCNQIVEVFYIMVRWVSYLIVYL